MLCLEIVKKSRIHRRAAGPVKKSYRGDAEAAEAEKKPKKIIVRYCILCDLSASAVLS